MERRNAMAIFGHFYLVHASLGLRWNVGDLKYHVALPGLAGGMSLQMFPNVCVT